MWEFFDQYPIGPGSCIWVGITYSGGTSWGNWLWWNGVWNLLDNPDIGFAAPDRGDEDVEIYSADGFHPTVGTIGIDPSYVNTTAWNLWTTAIPSYETNTGSPDYALTWNVQWYDWSVSR